MPFEVSATSGGDGHFTIYWGGSYNSYQRIFIRKGRAIGAHMKWQHKNNLQIAAQDKDLQLAIAKHDTKEAKLRVVQRNQEDQEANKDEEDEA